MGTPRREPATSRSEETDADRAFARYARSRDPELLAAVFDATAPKLLLVAMHLARDAAAAEDLVQATFLTAMRVPERYDPSRPVLPWLAGVLANEAAMARRRERFTPAAPVANVPEDPAAIAQTQELLDRVSATLDAMPEPYRTVLVLRLVNGLRAVQIAHGLGRSPETVRTQLHRAQAVDQPQHQHRAVRLRHRVERRAHAFEQLLHLRGGGGVLRWVRHAPGRRAPLAPRDHRRLVGEDAREPGQHRRVGS